jgi:hypothetical protein
MATEGLQQLRRLAPADMAGYAESLEAGEGRKDGVFCGVVWMPPRKARLVSADAPVTALYVKPGRSAKGDMLQAMQLLEELGPWTMESIPYYPKPAEGLVVSRKVTKQEVMKLVARQRKERPELEKQLVALGITVKPMVAVPPEQPVMQDVAFEVLRREFGIQGPAQPHFRPMQRSMVRGAERLVGRLAAVLQDPKNQRWRSEKRLPVVQGQVLEAIGSFQSRVTL